MLKVCYMSRASFKHLEATMAQFLKRCASCYRGWWQWYRLCKETGADSYTALILIPSDLVIAHYALLYLERFLTVHSYKNAVVVSTDMRILQRTKEFSGRILSVRRISERQESDLIQFMCLYKADKRLICASLDIPKGRNGSRLVGKKGVSMEEVFAVGVYGLYPFG